MTIDTSAVWSFVTTWAPVVVTAASAAAATLPVPSSQTSTYGQVLGIIHWLAMNIGNAKSTAMAPATPAVTTPAKS